MEELKALRDRIDEIDEELVQLLEARASVVLKVKEIKSTQKLAVYSPAREREIFERVQKLAEGGHFPKGALETIFRNIVGATRSLLEELHVAYVGMPHSVSHEAAMKQFGEAVDFVSKSTFEQIFTGVEKGEVNFAVIPLESEEEGIRLSVIDCFLGSGVSIVGEVSVQKEGELSRFAVLGTDAPPPSGRDKTTLLCSVQEQSGALHDLLRPFADEGVTLVNICSRPMRKRGWEFVFFIELLGHSGESKVQAALEKLRKTKVFVKLLGSYPIGVER